MLKFQLDSLEGLDDATKALYAKDDTSGKFFLQVEGAVAKTKLDEFRNNNVELLRKLEAFKDIDPAKYKELLELQTRVSEKKLLDAGKIDEIVEGRIAKLKTDHAAEVSGLTTKLDSSNRQLETLVIDSEVRRVSTELGVVPTAIDDVLLRAKGQFKVVNGTATALDANGQPVYGRDGTSPLSVKEWASDLKRTASHLFPSSTGGGANGGGSGNRGGQVPKSAVGKIGAGLRSASA